MSRTTVFRAEHVKTDDSGEMQTVDLYGHAGEMMEAVHRVQPHGFSSNPPEGSHGIGFRASGESDLAVILGFEHQDHRPKNLDSGDAAFYSAKSVLLQTKGDDLNHSQSGTYTMTVKSLVIKCGGVTVTIDSNGLAIAGGKVTHDGHDIGKTHQHKDTQPGGGLSGVPQ